MLRIVKKKDKFIVVSKLYWNLIGVTLIVLAICVGFTIWDIYYDKTNKIDVNTFVFHELSSFVNNKYVNESDNTLYIQKTDIDYLNSMYETFNNEFSMCFEIIINQEGKKILKKQLTQIVNSNESEVNTRCYVSADVLIHSHPQPFGACMFSDQDKKSFEESSKSHYGVICGVNKFYITNRSYSVTKIGVLE